MIVGHADAGTQPSRTWSSSDALAQKCGGRLHLTACERLAGKALVVAGITADASAVAPRVARTWFGSGCVRAQSGSRGAFQVQAVCRVALSPASAVGSYGDVAAIDRADATRRQVHAGRAR